MPRRDNRTEEEKQRSREEKRAKIKSLQARLKALTEEERAALVQKAGIVTIEGRSLSPHNQCMLMFQMENPTIVGGYQQFKRAGRQVKKGEHGSIIWVPTGQKEDQNGNIDLENSTDEVNFITVNVFDISQTEEITAEKEYDPEEMKPIYEKARQNTLTFEAGN